MMKRYPHVGYIVTKRSTQNEDGDFIDSEVRIEVKGRYEPSNQSNQLDYAAKFFCRTIAADAFSLDESSFEYEGKRFTIVQLHNYQRHCEIWLT